MNILIIGASGMAGQAIYREATARGHKVTGLVRNEAKGKEVLGQQASLIAGDAFSLTKETLSHYDVVVNAFSAAPDKAYLHVDLAARLVAELRDTTSPRLFFILGAGSLLDAQGKPFVETLKALPSAAPWIGIPVNQFKELQFLREVDNVNWVGVSPSAEFAPGEKHAPVLGTDHLLTASDGRSHVSNATLAAAVLNEIETPSVLRSRFTVSD